MLLRGGKIKMNNEEIVNYLQQNFNEFEIFLMLVNMIEVFIPKERTKEYLERTSKLLDEQIK
jgi:hypothetical protein